MHIQLKDVLGQAFKVYGTVEEPLFLAKDVAEWIEYTNLTVMMKLVEEDEIEDLLEIGTITLRNLIDIWLNEYKRSTTENDKM
ncbi:hypothetical protein ABR768_11840 [Bacillus mycoides]|nr:hypothetical protein [Bacillus mycoides]